MNTQLNLNPCPQCGTPIPGDAPQGLCPRCVLARAATPTEGGSPAGGRLVAPALEVVAAAFPALEILELLGFGGMGVVYNARQPQLGRLVALKLLPQSLGADPAFAERFQREARCLARLHHPNIVNVYEFGQSGGFCYLLLEYVDGVNLRQAMQAGRFSAKEALAIVPAICGALQYAHEQGVLHRDIKPENILLDTHGTVKLADFGIAKLLREPGDTQAELTLTQTGSRLGTPHYMAPEQVENPGSVDHRADIYSLGVVFYELLTGELPLGRFAAPSAKADLDARVDAIVFRALAKERELRQQSAGEVRTDVEGLSHPPPPGPDSPRTAPDVAPNPWPNRLFWLLLGLVVLPVAAVIAGILAPALMRGVLRSSGGLIAALVPVVAGAALVLGYRQSRPGAAQSQPRAAWNPWPRRVFWSVIGLVVLPGLLVVIGLIVPIVAYRQHPLPTAIDPSLPEAAGGGLPNPVPAPNANLPAVLPSGPSGPTPSARKWQLAGEQLGMLRKQSEAGVVPPHGQEILAAERDLAVAEAELRGDAAAVAAARLTYAKSLLANLQRQFDNGLVSASELNAAKTAVADAEIALQQIPPAGTNTVTPILR